MPASWRTSDLTVLAVAGAGTVLLTGASFLVAPPDALPRNDGSSYAAHPDGARAAYLLLKGLGYRVDRSFEPVAAIRYAAGADDPRAREPVGGSLRAGHARAPNVHRARRARACDGSGCCGLSAGLPARHREGWCRGRRAGRAGATTGQIAAWCDHRGRGVDRDAGGHRAAADRLALRRDVWKRTGAGSLDDAPREGASDMVGGVGAARQWRDRAPAVMSSFS